VSISVDSRTGKVNLRPLDETGITGQKEIFLAAENRINQAPHQLAETLSRLRYQVSRVFHSSQLKR
jgi:hypothetical protein